MSTTTIHEPEDLELATGTFPTIGPKETKRGATLAFFAWTLAVYDFIMFGTLLPRIAEDFGWNEQTALLANTLVSVGVFVVGLVLVLGGAGLWMFSLLLCLPVVLAGLWTWSREFHWGHRLYAAVSARAALLWATARSRPGHAALLSVGGLASGAALSWLAASAHVVERVAEALGR